MSLAPPAPSSTSTSSSPHITSYAVLPHCSLPASAHRPHTDWLTVGLRNTNKLSFFFIKFFIFYVLGKTENSKPFGQTKKF